jgi:murein DD-endopeptidase MepM/ murein hydrolase activator NlpD
MYNANQCEEYFQFKANIMKRQKTLLLSILVGLIISVTACMRTTPSIALDIKNSVNSNENIPLGNPIPSSTYKLLVKNRSTPSPTFTSIAYANIDPSPTVSASPIKPTPSPSLTITPSRTPISSLCSPLVNHPIDVLPKIVSDGYDPPPQGHDERHHGVDFSYYNYLGRAYIEGVEVQSIFSGLICAVIEDSFPYGNVVIIETPQFYLPRQINEKFNIRRGESLYILFAHLDKETDLTLGEQIPACYAFNEVGRSGNSVVYHLHLETRVGPSDARFNSMSAFVESATAEDRENYRRWRTSGEFRLFDPMDLLLFEF